jgi:DNA-binding GntR family transcriptional regulator
MRANGSLRIMSTLEPRADLIPRTSRHANRSALSKEVADTIRSLIMSGELRQGEFIRLDRFAEELSVSVTPVREGLLMLQGEGFVTLEPRRGFLVAPLSAADVADIFYVQASLAGELAARAKRNLDDEQLNTLHRLQASLKAAIALGHIEDEAVTANHEFHRTINLSAESPKLAWFLALAVRCVPTRFFATIEGWGRASIDDHERILKAFEEGDSEDARRTMSEHYRHAGDLLVAHLAWRLNADASAPQYTLSDDAITHP